MPVKPVKRSEDPRATRWSRPLPRSSTSACSANPIARVLPPGRVRQAHRRCQRSRLAGGMLGSTQRLLAKLIDVAPAIGVSLDGSVLSDAEAAKLAAEETQRTSVPRADGVADAVRERACVAGLGCSLHPKSGPSGARSVRLRLATRARQVRPPGTRADSTSPRRSRHRRVADLVIAEVPIYSAAQRRTSLELRHVRRPGWGSRKGHWIVGLSPAVPHPP